MKETEQYTMYNFAMYKVVLKAMIRISCWAEHSWRYAALPNLQVSSTVAEEANDREN